MVFPRTAYTYISLYLQHVKPNPQLMSMAKPIAKRLKTKYYYCSNLVYDNDNISAILFDGGYASVDDDNGIVMHLSVANISIIDVHYVGSIKDPNGGYGYPMIKDYSDFLKSQQKFKNK